MTEQSLKSIEVAAALIWQDGRFLAARRPAHVPFAGYWELPGGKLEPGETPQEALRRELAEELRIDVGDVSYLETKEHVYPDAGLRVILHFFEVRDFTGRPQPAEGQEIRWISPTEAGAMEFLEADALFLAALVPSDDM